MKKFLYLLLGIAWFMSLPILADTLLEQGSQEVDGSAASSTTQGNDGDC